ncbi:MAG: hypothetical protein NC240_07165 [Clostridium sp.]|nr:hypothetical protein [Clostridium sp.]
MNYLDTAMYTVSMYQAVPNGTEHIKNAADGQKTKTASAKNETFSEAIQRKREQEESAVDKYKKKHPKEALRVESQVRAGQRVLAKNNAENVSRDDMTMEEYKQFFTGLMNSIPYDSSQRNDMNVWTISEKGWEQMKHDPQYEAWVLGYTAEDRSVHNPWAAMPGYSPNYHTESFGASIEEHLGQSSPMGNMGSRKTQHEDEEESWWVRRNKIMTAYIRARNKRLL